MPPVLTVFLSDDLTTDGLSVSARTGDGLVLTVTLLAGPGAGRRGRPRHRPRRRAAAPGARRCAAGQAGRAGRRRLALVVLLGALALSDRGIGGTISHQAD